MEPPDQTTAQTQPTEPAKGHKIPVGYPLRSWSSLIPAAATAAAAYYFISKSRPKLVPVAASAVLAYHGYARTGTIQSSAGYAVAGLLFPLTTLGLAILQGFGEKREPDPWEMWKQ